MFGYVRPFKPELKICEYDTYKAVYCGLCRQLGHSFGPFARFTLSYDFTLLALISMSILPDKPEFQRQRCFANPLKKCMSSQPCFGLDFSADCAMIFLYYKIQDNLADSGFGGRLLAHLAQPFAAHARKKAMERHPAVETVVAEAMADQARLEKALCPSVDEASEPTARCLGAIFRMLDEDPLQQRVLERMGYLLGRYVYLCDALDDIEDDLKTGSYNAFVLSAGLTPGDTEAIEACRKQAVGSLYLTTGELGKTYELLTLYRYQGILSNVMYLGLQNTIAQILNKKEKNHG